MNLRPLNEMFPDGQTPKPDYVVHLDQPPAYKPPVRDKVTIVLLWATLLTMVAVGCAAGLSQLYEDHLEQLKHSVP